VTVQVKGKESGAQHTERHALLSRLFRVLDVDSSNTVDLGELTNGLSVLCAGTGETKMRYAFMLFGGCTSRTLLHPFLRGGGGLCVHVALVHRSRRVRARDVRRGQKGRGAGRSSVPQVVTCACCVMSEAWRLSCASACSHLVVLLPICCLPPSPRLPYHRPEQ
jgi:hypothetical protein